MRFRTCVAILFVCALAIGQDQSPAVKAQQLKQQLNQQKSKKQKLARELAKTNRRIGVVAGDIKWVDNRLDQLEAELGNTTRNLEQNRDRQRRLAVDLVETTKELARVKVQVQLRLRSMYMHGETSFFSVAVGTQSVGDLVSRKVLQDSIKRQDHRLFANFTELKKQVSEKKAEQDRTVSAIVRFEHQQQQQQSDLEDARDEKNDLLSNLKDTRDQQQEMMRQFEQDEREISGQIAEYMRRAREQAERTGAKLPVFSGRLSRPIGAPVTSQFGMRFHPILHKTRLHAGCDFGARTGSPISAAGDGVVISTAYMRGYGNTVIIDHGGGIQTVYAHTSRIFVSSGQRVTRGQRIAAVGATGLATAPHLHFEVHVNGHAVNPLSRL